MYFPTAHYWTQPKDNLAVSWSLLGHHKCLHISGAVKGWYYCVVTKLVQVLVASDILHPWTTPLGYQSVWKRGLITNIILQFSDP